MGSNPTRSVGPSGGTSRRARLRSVWLKAVEVRILPWACGGSSTAGDPLADVLKVPRKYVVTRALERAIWCKTTIIAFSRYDSALTEIVRARELDPLGASRHGDVAWAYWVARRYDDAIRVAQEAIAMDSTGTSSYLALGGSYDATGRHAEAVAAFESGVTRAGDERLLMTFLAFARARAGRPAEARRVLAQLQELYRTHLASPYYIAQVYLALGRRDSALTWLEAAYQEGWGHVVWLDAGYQWDALRGDPRFEALREKVGLK